MMTCDVDDGMMYHVQSLVHGRKGGIHEHVLLYSWSSSYERRMAFQRSNPMPPTLVCETRDQAASARFCHAWRGADDAQ